MTKAKPPKEEGRAENAADLANCDKQPLPQHIETVNPSSLQERWEAEGGRILGLYRQTGNAVHLKAFRVHQAAMGARLSGLLGSQPG